MNLTITIHNEDLVAELEARGELLQAAILETMGGLGEQLLERAQSKVSPDVRTAIGEQLLASITLQAAAYIDAVCQTSVFVPQTGAPSYIVAYVREFGHRAFDIFPLETTLSGIGETDIGAGIKSPFSQEGSQALKESRLPHSLAWSEGGGMVFAMHAHIPAWEGKPYLRSSLEEMQIAIKEQLTASIAEVLAA